MIDCNLLLWIERYNAPVRFKRFISDYYGVLPRFDLKILEGRGDSLFFAVNVDFTPRADVESHVCYWITRLLSLDRIPVDGGLNVCGT